MGKTWKIVLGLALALPMLAYVAGSLVAAGDEPGDRAPIEFIENPTTTDGTSGDKRGPDRKKDGQTGKDKGNKLGTSGDKPGKGQGSSGPGRSTPPPPEKKTEVIQPGPRDLDDDDDDGGDDDDDGAGDDDD